jgi:hypothetical protein
MKFQWPINTWPKGKYHKTLGPWYNKGMIEGLSEIAKATFTRGLKTSCEKVELCLVDVRKGFGDKKIHIYLPKQVYIYPKGCLYPKLMMVELCRLWEETGMMIFQEMAQYT